MTTTIDLDDLPVASLERQGRAAAGPSPANGRDRRQFFGTVVRGATFLGLSSLLLFRGPRRAGAENPPWTEFLSCGPFDPGTPGVDHPCHDNMCIGTTLDLMDNFYCTIDCAAVDANNPYQWHKNKAYGPYSYRDYPGDICSSLNPGEAPRDAWRWSVGRCGFCNPSVYRCHDGQKRTNPSGEWQFTICEGLATCSGAPVTC